MKKGDCARIANAVASSVACRMQKREAAPHNKKTNKSWLIPSPNFGIGHLKVQRLTGELSYFAIDTLAERFEYEDEVIDVYLPLDKPPFDRIGRVTTSAQAP